MTSFSVTSYLLERPLSIAFALFGIAALSILYTHFSSRRRFAADMKQLQLPGEKGSFFQPPRLPFTYPLVGHTFEYIASAPMHYWRKFVKTYSLDAGVYTLLLGGDVTHMIIDQTAIQQLYLSKVNLREDFVIDIFNHGFGLNKADANRFYRNKDAQEKMLHDYLLKNESVTELSSSFCRIMQARLNEQPGEQRVKLMEWLFANMFVASTTALLGDDVFELYPTLFEDFWKLIPNIMVLILQIPKFWKPEPYKSREALVTGMAKWQTAMMARCNGEPPDPATGQGWEPVYGSRLSRARQRFYLECGFAARSRASGDLALLFALAGNAVPLTSWVILHILHPKSGEPILEPVMRELQTAVKPDGSLDMVTLTNLPLLQSVYHEALREYTDIVVSRNIPEDTSLPFCKGQKQALLRKGETAMIATYLPHHSPANWEKPDEFCPHRFLKFEKREDGAKCPVFSSTGTSGKLVPFGGGRFACPGRKFARQEIVAGVAMVLLSFEIEVHGCVDKGGNSTDKYPEPTSPFPGSGVMQPMGDLSVTLRRKTMGW